MSKSGGVGGVLGRHFRWVSQYLWGSTAKQRRGEQVCEQAVTAVGCQPGAYLSSVGKYSKLIEG